MITPKLKQIVLKWEPDSIDDFVIPCDADIGIEGEVGADYFNFRMVTPKRLLKFLEEDRIVNGKAVFIVNEAHMDSNIRLVTAEINKILENCARETWEEVALAINCYLNWEYYDPVCGICDFYKRTRNIE